MNSLMIVNSIFSEFIRLIESRNTTNKFVQHRHIINWHMILVWFYFWWKLLFPNIYRFYLFQFYLFQKFTQSLFVGRYQNKSVLFREGLKLFGNVLGCLKLFYSNSRIGVFVRIYYLLDMLLFLENEKVDKLFLEHLGKEILFADNIVLSFIVIILHKLPLFTHAMYSEFICTTWLLFFFRL